MSSIFLSHNSRDKYFVRKLKDDLKRDGIRVWFDEDEMKVGDSLIDKISEGISTMEYVGVILSKNSVDSVWVKKEVAIAMTEEIRGKKVKVLPILLEDCEIPPFLTDKIYADFRRTFIDGYRPLLDVLAPDRNILPEISDTEIDRLLETAQDIYTIDELKDKISIPIALNFSECEKLAKTIEVFKGNQTVMLHYVSSMSLPVCESLKDHNYPFKQLCNWYFEHLDKLFTRPFGFGFLDTIADFLRQLLRVVEDYVLRLEILSRIRNMGINFNRYYVMELFENIVSKIQTKEDVKAISDILKDASEEEIDRYLSNAKTPVSIKLLTALKSRKS